LELAGIFLMETHYHQAGEQWANWCRLGYELPVVNITTANVCIPSN